MDCAAAAHVAATATVIPPTKSQRLTAKMLLPTGRGPTETAVDTSGRKRHSCEPMRQVIEAPDAPSSPLFSQAARAGDCLFVSGLVGVDMTSGTLAGPTIQEQTRQALANCQTVLRAADAGLDDVVEVGVLLVNPNDFAGMNEEYARWFPAAPPARYVAKLGVELPGVLVSIRMTAFTG